MLKILLALDEVRSSTQHIRSWVSGELPVRSFFHNPTTSLNFPSWDDAGNELMQETKVEWNSEELSFGHDILPHLFQYFIGRHYYCRIALLKSIFNSSTDIFKFWIIYSKKMCVRCRKEEIHTFVVGNYWYHRSVQSSSTIFVSALHFADKFRDYFRRKFCDFVICLCKVSVRTMIYLS